MVGHYQQIIKLSNWQGESGIIVDPDSLPFGYKNLLLVLKFIPPNDVF